MSRKLSDEWVEVMGEAEPSQHLAVGGSQDVQRLPASFHHPGFRGEPSALREVHEYKTPVSAVFRNYAAAMMYAFAGDALSCAKSPRFTLESQDTGERITMLDRFAQGVMIRRQMRHLLTDLELAVMMALHSYDDTAGQAVTALGEHISEDVCRNRALLRQLVARHFEGRTSPRTQRSQRRIAHELGLHLRSVQRIEDRVRRALHDLEDSGRDKILPFLSVNLLIPTKIP